ncbi:MAG: tRNA pseudouridine(38-40) synthase TruA [Clostridia bacterium]|nr:tRNA pseudouridine(38-40) synthase TruA [Clostridia bacterium]
MENVLLTLQYDGTRYHGWQVQPNGITVQETLQNAIERITGTRSAVTGCSRTDAGVHANRFYCTTGKPEQLSEDKFVQALNAVLPFDVAVLACRTVDDNFHPRYSAVGKQYVYRIWNGNTRNPFEQGRALHVRAPLDAEQLNTIAEMFVGTHDFSAFCSAGSSVQDKVRTVRRSTVTRQGDLVLYTVEADGFLYNMVRILVGTILDVNNGRLTPENVREALCSGNRDLAGATAPACGLFLNEVWYKKEEAET